MAESRRTIDIAPAAIAKVIAAIVLVWLWLHLWQLVMLIVIAIVLAISLDPIVLWLEGRRLPRTAGSTLVVLLIAGLIAGFFYVSGASLTTQARLLSDRLGSVQEQVKARTPPFILRAVERGGSSTDTTAVAGFVIDAGRMVVAGLVVGVIALILTIYLLIDGRRTYTWLIAYVPVGHQQRVHVTAAEAQRAILGYVLGNVATAVCATIFVLIMLTAFHVPAALLLAVFAGVFDFIPVLGFICSSVPAILLALTVSGTVALSVLALYVAYHVFETYYLAPKVYGGRLRLSHLAVILAFSVGAEVGGLVGAILALPIAAMYPVIESVWLKDYLARDAVESHRRIENQAH